MKGAWCVVICCVAWCVVRGAWCVVRGAQFLCRSEARRSKDTFVGRGRYGTISEGHRYIWYGTLLRRCAQLKHSIVEQLYRWVLYLKKNKQTTTRNTHKHKYTHQRPQGPALQHRKTHTPHSRLHGARLIMMMVCVSIQCHVYVANRLLKS